MLSTKNIPNPVVFFRVAWMKKYEGVTSTDIPRGAGSHIKEYENGGEVTNFKKIEGYYFSDVWIAGDRNINLSRLEAKIERPVLKGVTIIFFSTDPFYGGQYIVGCYKNAFLYSERRLRTFSDGSER